MGIRRNARMGQAAPGGRETPWNGRGGFGENGAKQFIETEQGKIQKR